MKAFSRKGVHVAGTGGEVDEGFGLAGDAVHVGAEEGVDAGGAEEEAGWGVSATFEEEAGGFGDFPEMGTSNDIGSGEFEVGEAFAVAAGTGEGTSVAAAAGGGDEEHDGTGNGEAGTLDAEALGTRRVEVNGGGGAEDEVAAGGEGGGEGVGGEGLEGDGHGKGPFVVAENGSWRGAAGRARRIPRTIP